MGIIFTEPLPAVGLPAGAYARVERYEVGRTPNGPQELHTTMALYVSKDARMAGAAPLMRAPHVFPQEEGEETFDGIAVSEVYNLVMTLPQYANAVTDEGPD